VVLRCVELHIVGSTVYQRLSRSPEEDFLRRISGRMGVTHGLLVATLMRWFSVLAMLPFLVVELTAGLVAADYFFDIRPAKEGQ
jgi:hypothetical protein